MNDQRSRSTESDIDSSHDLQIVVDIPLGWIERFEGRSPIKEIANAEIQRNVVCNPGSHSGAVVVSKHGVRSEIAVPRVVKKAGKGRRFIPAIFRWLEPSPTHTDGEIWTNLSFAAQHMVVAIEVHLLLAGTNGSAIAVAVNSVVGAADGPGLLRCKMRRDVLAGPDSIHSSIYYRN